MLSETDIDGNHKPSFGFALGFKSNEPTELLVVNGQFVDEH